MQELSTSTHHHDRALETSLASRVSVVGGEPRLQPQISPHIGTNEDCSARRVKFPSEIPELGHSAFTNRYHERTAEHPRLHPHSTEQSSQFHTGSVFDNRWLQQPHEVWSSEGHHHSPMPSISPKQHDEDPREHAARSPGPFPETSIASSPHVSNNPKSNSGTCEQEPDAASTTGSTISTHVSSIFDKTHPSCRYQIPPQCQQGQHMPPDHSSQTTIQDQVYANATQPQHHPFHQQFTHYQTSLPYNPSPMPQYSQRLYHGDQHLRWGSSPISSSQDQRAAPTYITGQHGSPYAVPEYIQATQALQTRFTPMDLQHSRPTLPPSGRRQASMATYERWKAQQLADQNKAMFISNIQMQHALSGFAPPQYLHNSLSDSTYRQFPQQNLGGQYALSSHQPGHEFHYIPVPESLDQSQFRGLPVDKPSTGFNFSPNIYHQGSEAMNPRSNGGSSEAYRYLLRSGKPTMLEALSKENIPFTTSTATQQGTSYGVVRLGNVSQSLVSHRNFLKRVFHCRTCLVNLPIACNHGVYYYDEQGIRSVCVSLLLPLTSLPSSSYCLHLSHSMYSLYLISHHVHVESNTEGELIDNRYHIR